MEERIKRREFKELNEGYVALKNANMREEVRVVENAVEGEILPMIEKLSTTIAAKEDNKKLVEELKDIFAFQEL